MKGTSKATEGRETIVEAWRNELCPIVNGIYYASGRVVRLDVDQPASVFEAPSVRIASETSYRDLAEDDATEWTSLTSLGEVIDQKGMNAVVYGEGGFGGDGFVALINRLDDKLAWLAFSDCANPFVSAEIFEDVVVAVNNSGVVWRFPIAAPEQVTTASAIGR